MSYDEGTWVPILQFGSGWIRTPLWFWAVE
jgi:hypothetical protein